MIAMDMTQPFPTMCRHFPERHVRNKENANRKRSLSVASVNSEGATEADNSSYCILCLRYNSMLYMNWVAPGEFVVVEQPWLQVVANFPEALDRRVYGT